jgi:hypothetical protein
VITRLALVLPAVLHTGWATPLIAHGSSPMKMAG